jgi:hypothetical protein
LIELFPLRAIANAEQPLVGMSVGKPAVPKEATHFTGAGAEREYDEERAVGRRKQTPCEKFAPRIVVSGAKAGARRWAAGPEAAASLSMSDAAQP